MKGKIGAIILGIVMVFCLIACIVCLEKIPAGYVGVVYNMNGGVDGEVLTQGWHLVAPTKKVTQYSIGIEQSYLTAEDKGDSPKDESFNIPTSDGKTVRVNIEFSYRFDEARVSETFAMFKESQARQSRIRSSNPRSLRGHRRCLPTIPSLTSSATSVPKSMPSWTPICVRSSTSMALLSTR